MHKLMEHPSFTQTGRSGRRRKQMAQVWEAEGQLASHPLRRGRVRGGLVEVPAEVGVEAAGRELLVLLAERAGLAAAVDAAVAAGRVGEPELRAHLLPVRAGVDPLAPRQVAQQRVQRAARPARRRPPVHDLRDPAERDARAPARQATWFDWLSVSFLAECMHA
jgi:hypothetical protein